MPSQQMLEVKKYWHTMLAAVANRAAAGNGGGSGGRERAMSDTTRSISSDVGAARADQIAVGAPAPGFELKDQDTKTHTLSDYRGRWVVLYFYPRDNTPACTTEACNFRDDLPTLRALGVQILGVSVGNTESHARFAEKHSLPFPLLADHGGAVAKIYGSLWSLGPIKFAKRHTFVIDPEGKIARIYRHVKSKEHSRQVIEDVEALKRG